MFTKFKELPIKQQEELTQRYKLPADTTKIVVRTSNNLPCELIKGLKVACQVNMNMVSAGSFHNHETKCN